MGDEPDSLSTDHDMVTDWTPAGALMAADTVVVPSPGHVAGKPGNFSQMAVGFAETPTTVGGGSVVVVVVDVGMVEVDVVVVVVDPEVVVVVAPLA